MKWLLQDPGGYHQYATNIGWAVKQTNRIASRMAHIYERYTISLRFDRPNYLR